MTTKTTNVKAIFGLLLINLMFITIGFGQVTNKISYQAVIRDADNELVKDTQIGVRISILQGAADGAEIHSETVSPLTNENGLVVIEFGEQLAIEEINLTDGPYFIKTEIDPTGGSNYTITGASQIYTVPFAVHSKTAESISGEIAESDPVFQESIDVTDAVSGNVLKFDGEKFIPSLQQTLTIEGSELSISEGNTVILPSGTAGESGIPVLTTEQIATLEPETGDAVFNASDNLYQIFTGTHWFSLPADCWPQPTTADAGSHQTFTDNTTSTSLNANVPVDYYGTGLWSIISGEGGSFDDAANPETQFSGEQCENYTLRWTITTTCGESSDDVNITFNHTPTVANAGPDQSFIDGTTSLTLAANTPSSGTGQWSIVSGDGGSFDDVSNPNATFTGQINQIYSLEWSIETSCSMSADEVFIYLSGGTTDFYTEIIDITNPTTGKTWMDRNLGASRAATSSTDAEAYGDLYQWGRAADGHQIKTSSTTSTLSNSDTPGHGNFILAPSNPSDWRSPQNTNLWQGVNGTNNPCPVGYRLPTEAELNAERSTWSSNNAGGAYASPLKLPLAGGRYYGSGSLTNVGSFGHCWSSTVDGTDSHSLSFGSSDANVFSISRAFGFSVRCLKD